MRIGQRLNLTVDADLVRLARRVAHERDTSVSALAGEFFRNLPTHAPGSGAAFVAKTYFSMWHSAVTPSLRTAALR
jgi:hypothetical protein